MISVNGHYQNRYNLMSCSVQYTRLVHNSLEILFPVAVGLFIDCHFLFEVKLLCLSLHIEVLSFEHCE